MRYDLRFLRGFSVLLVFLYHLDILGFEGGFIGVAIFFVLSGFFTARMLSCKHQNITNVTNFLNRRLVRLMPNLLFYILVTIPSFRALSQNIKLQDWGVFSD